MLKHLIGLSLLAAGLVMVPAAGTAQNEYTGVNIYVTGDSNIDPPSGFSPGDASNQLLNDGTGGDAIASDGIWTRDVTATAPSGHFLSRTQWKVASTGFSPVSIPGGFANSYTRISTTGSVTRFFFDTVTRNDGYIPDPGVSGTVPGLLYTSPSPTYSTDTVRATGSFLSELGGSDWDANDNNGLMVDDGTGGDDINGDGIYTKSMTGLPPDTYAFKITFNGSFDLQISENGYSTDGNNLTFASFSASDNIRILFDSNYGRVKVENDNPLANPGPPFFATSDAWGTTLDASTQLYDDGTNGDVTSGDGIHSRDFVVLVAGDHAVKARQGVGPAYPGTGDGYPMDGLTTGQAVKVQFDTNTPGDGYSPSTRYVWTDPASRRVPPRVQAVGDFMVDLGGLSDWNANDPFFELVDDGTSGDLTAADGVFAKNFGPTVLNNKNYKGVGSPNFDFQFGGAGDGYTKFGNNPNVLFSVLAGDVIFQIDAVTGRVGVGATGPTRPPSLNDAPASSVTDWSVY